MDKTKKTFAEKIQERRTEASQKRLDLGVREAVARQEAEQKAVCEALTKVQNSWLKDVEATVVRDSDQRHCLLRQLDYSEAVIITNTPTLLRELARLLDEEGLTLLVCVDRSIQVFNLTLGALVEIATMTGHFENRTVRLSDNYSFVQQHTYALLATWP